MTAGWCGRGARFRRVALSSLVCAAITACGAAPAPQAQLFDSAMLASLPAEDAAAVTAQFAAMFPAVDGRFVDSNCGPVAPAAEVIDLNRDGRMEVFVRWGNTCTSGLAGSSLSLFIAGPDGDYRHEFGFPAAGYRALPTAAGGYPDLEIGGPGFCFPVWAWRGVAYEYACDLPQQGGMCPVGRNLCPVP